MISRDRTETGHILGRATGLGPITAPERKLSRPAFAILRLLTHVSMYVGANLNKQVRYSDINYHVDDGTSSIAAAVKTIIYSIAFFN